MTYLDKLIEAAREVTMTECEREVQRRSFAYGNTKIENDKITRKMISDQATILAQRNG